MKKVKEKKVLGFICENDGREMSFDDYIEAVKRGEDPKAMPVPILEVLKNQFIKENKEKQVNGIRVTSLTGCLRNAFYKRKFGNTEEYVKPSDYYAMFRGTIAHKILEEAMKFSKDVVQEKRFNKKWKDMKITGKPDVIDVKNKKIVDYKTTRMVPEGVYQAHEIQLNLYKWLVEDKYKIKELSVIYMDMSKVKELNVRVWSDLELTEFLDNCYSTLKSKVAPKFEKNWLCSYCDYKSICKDDLVKDLVGDIVTKVEHRGIIKKSEVNAALRHLISK